MALPMTGSDCPIEQTATGAVRREPQEKTRGGGTRFPKKRRAARDPRGRTARALLMAEPQKELE